MKHRLRTVTSPLYSSTSAVVWTGRFPRYSGYSAPFEGPGISYAVASAFIFVYASPSYQKLKDKSNVGFGLQSRAGLRIAGPGQAGFRIGLVVGSSGVKGQPPLAQITVRGIYSLIAGKLSEGTDVVPELVEGAGRTAGRSDVKAVHRYTIARDRSYHCRSAVEVPEQNSISDKSPENVRKGVSCSLTGRGCGKLLLGTVLGSNPPPCFKGGYAYSRCSVISPMVCCYEEHTIRDEVCRL